MLGNRKKDEVDKNGKKRMKIGEIQLAKIIKLIIGVNTIDLLVFILRFEICFRNTKYGECRLTLKHIFHYVIIP